MLKKIGLDLDDVLTDTMPLFLQWHNETYGTRYGVKDMSTYHIEDLGGCTPEEANERHDLFRHSEHFGRVVPAPGAIEAVRLIAAEYTPHVITARNSNIREPTQKWLDTYFHGLIQDVHFTNAYSTDSATTPPRSKAEVCIELGIKTHIEDASEHARKCRDAGIQVILRTRPWNVRETGFDRFERWEDLLRMLLR
ncbi:hypothetical protein J4444_00360 [Candidatus Woesearchaeota archaeon]|nr:hypothetical protein [Candidatus Woesearchaeota archaeon]